MNRLHFMDGLRCIAAISVVIQHMLEHTAANNVFVVLSPGLFGVVLFFLISGFIIPYSVGNNLNPDKFAVTRAFRIFPAYLAVLALSLSLGWFGVHPFVNAVTGADKDASWLIANTLIIAEYVGEPVVVGVAWTLPLEFAWYALFALLFSIFGRRFALGLTIGLSATILLASIAATAFGAALPVGRISLINAASVGYLFYLWNMGHLSAARLNVGIAVFAAATALSATVTYTYFPHPNVKLDNMLITWGGALAFFVVIQSSIAIRTSTFLTNKVITWLGEISYSIYLLHGLFISLAFRLTDNLLLSVPLGVAMTIAASWLSYSFIERPGIALGRRLFRMMKDRNIEVLGHILPRPRKPELAGER